MAVTTRRRNANCETGSIALISAITTYAGRRLSADTRFMTVVETREFIRRSMIMSCSELSESESLPSPARLWGHAMSRTSGRNAGKAERAAQCVVRTGDPVITSACPETVELDHCLRDRGMPTGTMSVSTLEGYLVALIVGPGAPPEEDWLPRFWAGSRLACRVVASDQLRRSRHLSVLANQEPRQRAIATSRTCPSDCLEETVSVCRNSVEMPCRQTLPARSQGRHLLGALARRHALRQRRCRKREMLCGRDVQSATSFVALLCKGDQMLGPVVRAALHVGAARAPAIRQYSTGTIEAFRQRARAHEHRREPTVGVQLAAVKCHGTTCEYRRRLYQLQNPREQGRLQATNGAQATCGNRAGIAVPVPGHAARHCRTVDCPHRSAAGTRTCSLAALRDDTRSCRMERRRA